MNSYTSNPFTVAAASPADRASFYRRTYGLVAASCAAFGLILSGLLASPLADVLTALLFGNGMVGWLLVLGALWAISMFANRLAFGGASQSTQLAGLGLYVVAEAVIFTPLLNVCLAIFGPEIALSEIVAPAALSTLLLAGGLTATVFMTRTDFSFLHAVVSVGFFVALAAILVFALAGVNPGTWFVVAMVGFMAAVILYYTWAVKTQFRTDQHVGAALVIFAGIATLFWYLLQLFMSRRE